MSNRGEFRVLQLAFHGRKPELQEFVKKFDSVKWTSKHVRSLDTSGAMYYGGVPAELIVLVLSLAANIVTIADIIAKRLGDEDKDSIIRIDSKEIQLKGRWKPDEIAAVLEVVSEKYSEQAALKKIAEIKSAKIAETRKRLNELGKAIDQYERLLKVFGDIPEKKEWQEEKARNYQRKLDELRNEANTLKEFVEFLCKE